MNIFLLLRAFPVSLLLCVVLGVSPLLHFSLTPGASYHDNQRILQGVLLIVATAIFVVRLIGRPGAIPMAGRAMAVALALFFGLGVVAGLMAYSPRYALAEVSLFWLLLVLAALVAGEVVAAGCDVDRRLDQILLVCGVGCVIYIFQALTFYVVALVSHLQPTPQSLTPGFDNFRFFNHMQTVSLPLLALLTVRCTNPSYRGLWWRMTALWWMLLFVSGGRGSLVAALVGIAAAWLCGREAARPWCRVMLQTALVGLIAYAVLYFAVPWAFGLKPFGFLQEIAGRSIENPASGRLDLWRGAWLLIRDHPGFGIGPMHYAHFARDAHHNAHPHNWMLQIASEWGVTALFCLCAALMLAFRSLWRVRLRHPALESGESLMRAVLMATGVAVIADSFVSGLMVMPVSQLWMALYVGCAWGWLCTRYGRTESTAGRLPAVFLAVLTVIAVGCLLYAAFPEVLDIPAHEFDYRPPKREYFAPRFWRNGYF